MAEMSYEAARDELQKVVATLESGGLGLEESLKLWERGEELAAICQDWLDGARAKLESASQLASRNSELKSDEAEER